MPDRDIETIRLLGRTPYREAYDAQIARRSAVEAGDAGNALFLVEHTPAITLGRNFNAANLLMARDAYAQQGIEVVDVDRGGDVTYHGPGQVVAYPILDLNEWRPSIRWYLRSLEEVLIRLLARYGLKAGRVEGYTGVWVDGGKVAAIGIGVHNWVTFHGIALNVAPDMAHFDLIVPCGITDKPVTSLQTLMDNAPTVEQAFADFEEEFRAYFAEVRDLQV
ncbi:MAG: lipoyl(octanoyl) transferase LipB [bacterium]|nr:lipoyl(octanoyl) transferase LipB [bacterium]